MGKSRSKGSPKGAGGVDKKLGGKPGKATTRKEIKRDASNRGSSTRFGAPGGVSKI
jgi:hypothetical protein